MKRFVVIGSALIGIAMAVGSLVAALGRSRHVTPALAGNPRHANGDGDFLLKRRLPGEVWPEAVLDETSSRVAQPRDSAGPMPQLGGYGVDRLANDPAVDRPEMTTQSELCPPRR